jgi:hypothetical protein
MWGRLDLGLLFDLLRSGKADAQDRYEQLHAWRYERVLGRGKGLLATAATITTALALSFLKGEFKVAPAWVGVGVAGALLMTSSGLYWYIRGSRMDRDYARMLRLIAALSRLFP